MSAGYVGQFYGRRAYLTPQVRRMRPSPAFQMLQSPELVAETDRWMAEFFGYSELVPDGQVLLNEVAGTVHMNVNTYRQLRAAQASFDVKGVGL